MFSGDAVLGACITYNRLLARYIVADPLRQGIVERVFDRIKRG
jgi:hypothetical protein